MVVVQLLVQKLVAPPIARSKVRVNVRATCALRACRRTPWNAYCGCMGAPSADIYRVGSCTMHIDRGDGPRCSHSAGARM